jgi:hypothetical protein
MHAIAVLLLAFVLACSARPGTSASSSSSSGASASSSSSSGTPSGVGPWGQDSYQPIAAALGDAGNDQGLAVVVGFSNQVFVAGKFDRTLTLGGHTVTSAGAGAVFVAAFAGDGTVMWLKALDGQVDVPVRGLGFSSGRDGVTVVCNFSGTVVLDGQEIVGWGQRDILVFHINTSGNVLWTRRIGGAGDNVALSISRRGMLAGYFTAEMDVATGVLRSSGQKDAFFLELSDTGLIQGPQAFGGPGDDEAVDAMRLPTGELFVAGHFHDAITPAGVLLTSQGGQDVFVVVLPGAGAQSWAERLGGAGEDVLRQVAIPMDGDVIALLMDGTHELAPGAAEPGNHLLMFGANRTVHWTLEPPAGISVVEVTYSRRVLLIGDASSPFAWGATQVTPVQGGVVILKVAHDGTPDTATLLEGSSTAHVTAGSASGQGMLHLTGMFQGELHGPDGLVIHSAGTDAFLLRMRE